MEVFETADALAQALSKARLSGKTIGLVPTMGNLHQGHLALVEKARQDCDYVLATIFVNPMQFGPDEDFERYPKTLAEDQIKLAGASCDALFMPPVVEVYPNGLNNQTVVSVPALASLHCGKSRPIHFDGVCTVVSKLLNLTNPDKAYFGSKDFQQLLIIKTMVTDLCMPVEIIGVRIQRDANGLALSSRNSYLSKEEKKTAATLSFTLRKAGEKLSNGDFQTVEKAAITELSEVGMRVDYFSICNARTLEPASETDKDIVILAAVYLGETRLIDNLEFKR